VLSIRRLDDSVSIITAVEITMTLTGKRAFVTEQAGVLARLSKALTAEGADVATAVVRRR
jgi:hypothetical protein